MTRMCLVFNSISPNCNDVYRVLKIDLKMFYTGESFLRQGMVYKISSKNKHKLFEQTKFEMSFKTIHKYDGYCSLQISIFHGFAFL